MVAACQLVAQSHNHLLALREQLVHLLEILLISILVELTFVVGSHKGDVRHATCYLPLVLVAKDNVAILHHIEYHIVRLHAVSPKILAVVDVAYNSQSISRGKLYGIHSRLH